MSERPTGWSKHTLHQQGTYALAMLTVALVGAWGSIALDQPTIAMGFVVGFGGGTWGVLFALLRRLRPTE